MKGTAKDYFIRASGGKNILVLKRLGLFAGVGFLILTLAMAWFGPAEDRTYYKQTTQSQADPAPRLEIPGAVSSAIASLLNSGQKQKSENNANDAKRKKQSVAIKYFAPQIIGGKTAKSIRSGAKLVAFLVNTIDTRSPAAVRARVSQTGEANGIEIEKGSILVGQYSYSGSGDRLLISFNRLDSPDGDTKKIQAQALDARTYTGGIVGKVHSDDGLKVATQLGLTMFSGMADVLTEKESLGFAQNGVQAKSTMKNALLQGLSHSAQDQTSRMASDVNAVKDYLIVPEGKEIIIELTEDFK